MKEIKAYVKETCLMHVIGRLTQEGATDVAVSHVLAIGAFADAEHYRLKIFRQYMEQSPALPKLRSSVPTTRWIALCGCCASRLIPANERTEEFLC